MQTQASPYYLDQQLKRETAPSKRAEMDRGLTPAHERLIDTLNILARNVQKTGEPVDWRAALGTDRKEIGDWACLLHAHFGISAR